MSLQPTDQTRVQGKTSKVKSGIEVVTSQEKQQRRVMDMDEKCGVPMALYLDTEQVADWIADIGYPQYRECFAKNNVTGRHFINLDASKLPNMGITDFEHIKDITAQIRAMIGLKQTIRNMSVAMGDPMIAYLEMKRRTGRHSNNTTFLSFLAENRRWFKGYSRHELNISTN